MLASEPSLHSPTVWSVATVKQEKRLFSSWWASKWPLGDVDGLLVRDEQQPPEDWDTALHSRFCCVDDNSGRTDHPQERRRVQVGVITPSALNNPMNQILPVCAALPHMDLDFLESMPIEWDPPVRERLPVFLSTYYLEGHIFNVCVDVCMDESQLTHQNDCEGHTTPGCLWRLSWAAAYSIHGGVILMLLTSRWRHFCLTSSSSCWVCRLALVQTQQFCPGYLSLCCQSGREPAERLRLWAAEGWGSPPGYSAWMMLSNIREVCWPQFQPGFSAYCYSDLQFECTGAVVLLQHSSVHTCRGINPPFTFEFY